jgi:hypothetical protein
MVDSQVLRLGSGIFKGLAVGLVALGLFTIAIVLAGLGWVAVRCISEVWDFLGPLLEHEMLMRRVEVRLMIDDAGYKCPEWLNDERADDEEEGKVVRLVPKPEQDE